MDDALWDNVAFPIDVTDLLNFSVCCEDCFNALSRLEASPMISTVSFRLNCSSSHALGSNELL
jgi:hypothetical protein